MSTELVQTAQTAPTIAPSLFDLPAAQMVAHAADIATVLRDVIAKQRLAVNIQGREYVKVDGWAALGSILGFLPREVDVKELEDGSFEAKVELYSLRSGKVVGQGSALCGVDEKRWGGADRYARRSMAITRATGKAYRLGLSWVMTLAGYEATPAEEMIEIPFSNQTKIAPEAKPARKTASIYTGDGEQERIVREILVKRNVPEAHWLGIHNKLKGRPSSDLSKIIDEVCSTS